MKVAFAEVPGEEPPLPAGWQWKRIEQLGHVQLGRQRSPKNRSSRFPTKYLRAANITEQGLDLSDVLDMEFRPEELSRYRLAAGDLVLSEASGSSAHVGKPAIWKEEIPNCAFQNTVIRLRPVGASSQYLLWLFTHYYRSGIFARVAGGVGINHLSAAKFSHLLVPVAPREQQRQIVAEIEKQFTRLEAGVAALRRVQANLKRYRAAVLKAACEGRLVPTEGPPWADVTLGRVLTNVEAGRSFRCEERPPVGDEVGVIKVSAVTWGTYDETESKTCLESTRFEPKYLVRPGDFLFSRANTIDLIGACVIAKTVTLRAMLSDKILRFTFSTDVVPSWVLYWLRSEQGRNEIKRLCTGNQESMRNISQDRIRQIAIKVPPLTEQRRIVAEVERRLSVVDELDALVTANLQRATRLRQSILQRAFSGTLVTSKAPD
ncbi:MAG TPA: restriction endonuclease subunit S [Polyangia bacterium]|nr:restriction endonuclease subunit S [Polyangia bacterium]